MADIFLSYNENDRALVRRLAQALQSAGWSVWWDRRVPAGLTWRRLLEQELQDMRCMLVLWSNHSVRSEWVCEEATEGRLLGRLIPVFIEHVRPPAGFREVQAADLIGWDGSPEFAGLQQLLRDIEHKLGAPNSIVAANIDIDIDTNTADIPPRPGPRPHRLGTWPLRGTIALLLLALAGYFGLRPAKPDRRVVVDQPAVAIDPTPTAVELPRSPVSAPSTVAASAPKPAASMAAQLQVAPAKSPAKPRCAALRERQALGESLSSQSQLFFDKEC